jgi:hypothetical protein
MILVNHGDEVLRGERCHPVSRDSLARRAMTDLFRSFLDGVSARGAYCLDCLGEMYGEPARTVTRYLSESQVSGRLGTCTNCDEEGETFRSNLSS